jgi:pimeloyl-ACP methyl ester carboxylesterase
MLAALLVLQTEGAITTTRVTSFKGSTYAASITTSTAPGPPTVLLPPIGVGIDRSFCGKLLDEWAAQGQPGSLHAIDVIGMGGSSPKPRMRRRLGGGWDQPPRTPTEWAEQVIHYVRCELGEPAIVVGQSNLCTVALEAAALDPEAVLGVVLVGPPAIEALSIDKPEEEVRKVWRVVGSPLGALLYRFARRKAFLASFSKKNLFADPDLVDDAYLDVCVAGARDADPRHAVFSFVSGTWRRDYRKLLATLETPTLIVTGRDVGSAAKGSSGRAASGDGDAPPPSSPPPAPPSPASVVDRTSSVGLLRWFAVWRRGRNQREAKFDQVARDLGSDPQAKLRGLADAMDTARAAGDVESVLLPGWNVLAYESPKKLAATIGGFVRRRFGTDESRVTPPQPSLLPAIPASPAEIKERIWALARATQGGAHISDAEGAEMRRLVSQLESLNPTARAASSPLMEGEWDQIYTDNPGGGVVDGDGRTARRQLIGPLSGRITQQVSLGEGAYRQRVRAKLLGVLPVCAELLAEVEPEGETTWRVRFDTFALAVAGQPLRRKGTSGYTGMWTHTYLDGDTRVMRTPPRQPNKAEESQEEELAHTFVLRRAPAPNAPSLSDC